ncbi:MAG: hypothetical protein LBR52_05885 [Prevotellaceae bacterium]|jgi:hypothetical protein|nr:hypothetical protein [Prevotellaceae bacterium]
MKTIETKLSAYVLFIALAFSFQANAQVTIGADITPDASAVLDLQSNDKLGLLLPRIVLTDTLLAAPLTGHVQGMFVYNTASSADGKVKEGIYYNDGRRWWHLAMLDPTATDAWYTTGNTGTDPSKNFLGTTDDRPLAVKVNNAAAGYVSNIDGTENYNALGLNALINNSTGQSNNAFGLNALTNNTTGSGNNAFGYNALAGNLTGMDNTAMGNRALANTTAGGNTAFGSTSLTLNTGGAGNTAVGFGTLKSNVTGNDNTAVGVNALQSNTVGGNVAIGSNALAVNGTGGNNTAVGTYSLFNNSSGTGNTAVGNGTLGAASGNNNTALGNTAGSQLTTGSNNIAIGSNTNVLLNTGSNQMNIGNAIFGTGMDGSLAAPAGNIGIGTATPDSSAILELNAPDKGFLPPRVALTGPTDQATVANPQVGLMVYNTGTNSQFKTTGYMYWSGTEWRLFNGSTSTPANITGLNCEEAILSPAQYTASVPYEGVIKIPYSGGNGGTFTGGSSFTSNGLTFTLQGDILAVGSGELTIRVEGTPDISSPASVTIPVNPATAGLGVEVSFWTGTCSITVGDQVTADISTIAVMDYMRFMTDPDNGAVGFGVSCKTPDGLYTIRVWFRHSLQDGTATATNNTTPATVDVATNNVQIRNNSDIVKTLMWNYNTEYGGYIGGAGGNLQVPSGIFGGAVDGNAWVSSAPLVEAPWGNAGIYNATAAGPEHRRYTWIDTSTTTKVAYTATVMAGMDPGAIITDITKQKVFIKIEQITAP